MKYALVQHRIRSSASEDVDALARSVSSAVESGAEIVVLPAMPALADEAVAARLSQAAAGHSVAVVVPVMRPDAIRRVFETASVPGLSERVGPVTFLYGDACMDIDVLETLAAQRPAALLMSPASEGELQAEGMLELALGLSESVAGLVLIAETSGGEFGEAGHGGSVAVLLGEILAEAMADDEVLTFDVPEPIPSPEPPEALPQVPTILQQRLANHRGGHLDPGYLADLS